MYILGDIGNSEIKVFLLNSNYNIIRKIQFSSKENSNKILSSKFNSLIKDFRIIRKILFCSVVPKSFNLIKRFLQKKLNKNVMKLRI